MRKRFGMLMMSALVLIAAAISSGCGPKKTELSAADQQKMAALGDALKNGILSQSEYDVKVKELNAAASANAASTKQSSANSAADAQKLQALESACKSGVLSPEECAAKRVALTGTASTAGQSAAPASGIAVVSAPADAPASAASRSAAPMADNSSSAMASNPPTAGNGGNAPNNPPMSGGNGGNGSGTPAMANGTPYSDPQGAFQLVIPQGWTVSPQGENGAGGVQIVQGPSWAIISPFANAKQPSDVVVSVEGQLQRQYKNMTIGNHGPSKFQGKLDMAYARYTGINPQGAAVTVVVIGVASTDGRFFLVMSSIPQNDTQGANAAMTGMVQSLHFSGA